MIAVSKKAHKQLGKLPKADARAVYEALESLVDWPDCRNVKALTDRDGYRLRIGDYRAFFTVIDDTAIVTEVRRRNERIY